MEDIRNQIRHIVTTEEFYKHPFDDTIRRFQLNKYWDIYVQECNEAIKSGNASAMNYLGLYHMNITYNYDEMKKYFGMAIEHGSGVSPYNLGVYHETVTHKYEEMLRLYTISAKRRISYAVQRLTSYCFSNNKITELTKIILENDIYYDEMVPYVENILDRQFNDELYLKFEGRVNLRFKAIYEAKSKSKMIS